MQFPSRDLSEPAANAESNGSGPASSIENNLCRINHTNRTQVLESTLEIPILMYHSIDVDGPAELTPYRVPPAVFEMHIGYLIDNGYYTVSLEERARAIAVGQPFAGKPVIITFDDGYLNFLRHAWPVLERARFSATMFVVTEKVGQTADWDIVTGEALRLMSWEDLADLRGRGLTIGSHTAVHPSLPTLSTEDIVIEGKRARDSLRRNLGMDTTSIAFPYGHTDERVRAALALAGYTIGVKTWGGISTLADDPLNLPRIEIFPDDEIIKFAAKVATVRPPLTHAIPLQEPVQTRRVSPVLESKSERQHMLIHPDYAQRLAARLDSLVSDFVALHSDLLKASGQAPCLSAKLAQLFREPVTGSIRRDLVPYEALTSGIRVGFEKEAHVCLVVEPKTDFGQSPDSCINSLEFNFTGPSSWLSLEIECDWADLNSMLRYQLGVYATVSRRISGRMTLRLPSKDGKSISQDFANFALDTDRRNFNKSGELRNLDFVNIDTDGRPTLLLVFETRKITDVTIKINYLTLVFD